MRIYNRAEFMKLPAGTIFCKGSRWVFDAICVKGDTLTNSSSGDFCLRDLTCISAQNSGQLSDRLDAMLECGESYPLGDSYGRDGCFDDADLFLVYEQADLAELMGVITNAMALPEQG